MVDSLVQMVRELSVRPLAEGIESIGDHEMCRRIGFNSPQGYLYGKPSLPAQMASDFAARYCRRTSRVS